MGGWRCTKACRPKELQGAQRHVGDVSDSHYITAVISNELLQAHQQAAPGVQQLAARRKWPLRSRQPPSRKGCRYCQATAQQSTSNCCSKCHTISTHKLRQLKNIWTVAFPAATPHGEQHCCRDKAHKGTGSQQPPSATAATADAAAAAAATTAAALRMPPSCACVTAGGCCCLNGGRQLAHDPALVMQLQYEHWLSC